MSDRHHLYHNGCSHFCAIDMYHFGKSQTVKDFSNLEVTGLEGRSLNFDSERSESDSKRSFSLLVGHGNATISFGNLRL